MSTPRLDRARFESLAFQFAAPPARTPAANARAAIRAVLPGRWSLEPLGSEGEFEAIPQGPPVSYAKAWTLAYALRDQPGVRDAEPLSEIDFTAQFPRASRPTRDDFGPGIADALAVPQAPLPDAPPVRAVRRSADADGPRDRPRDWLVHLLAPVPRPAVIEVLSDLRRIPEARLGGALDDIGAELATRVGVDGVFREQLRTAADAAVPGRRTRGRPPTVAEARRRASDRRASPRLRGDLETDGR